jgi:hypothetical protein
VIAATRNGFAKAQAASNGTDLRPKPEPIIAETRESIQISRVFIWVYERVENR